MTYRKQPPKGWRIDSDYWPFPEFTATHEDREAE